MAWTSPRTWVAGETLTAAYLNVHVRDNLKAIGDAWTSYTPTWTGATANPTIGNGTIAAAYMQAGKLVTFRIQITMGSTTTYGTGLWSLTTPTTQSSAVANWPYNGFIVRSTTVYPVNPQGTGGATTVSLLIPGTTAGGALRALNATTPITFASGDIVSLSGTYEAA